MLLKIIYILCVYIYIFIIFYNSHLSIYIHIYTCKCIFRYANIFAVDLNSFTFTWQFFTQKQKYYRETLATPTFLSILFYSCHSQFNSCHSQFNSEGSHLGKQYDKPPHQKKLWRGLKDDGRKDFHALGLGLGFMLEISFLNNTLMNNPYKDL